MRRTVGCAARWMASLRVALAPDDAAAVRALARYPVIRGDHVTLAHGVDPAGFESRWVPGGAAPGASIVLDAVGHLADERVHALLVEIAGERHRPWDGGVLHVTVSRQPWARSSEANALALRAAAEPFELTLRGTIVWV